MKALTNKVKVERIQLWIDSVDIRVLVTNVCKFMLNQAKITGNYLPLKFAYTGYEPKDIVGNNFKPFEEEDLDEMDISTPIRLPVTLHDEVIEAADRLGCSPSDVVRMAIGGIYLDSGAGLLNAKTFRAERSFANYRDKGRQRSIVALKRERTYLQARLSKADLSEDDRRALETRLAAIKV